MCECQRSTGEHCCLALLLVRWCCFRCVLKQAIVHLLMLNCNAEFDNFPAGGFDSLSAVEMTHTLEKLLGLRLPATLVFDYHSVSALSKHLHELVVTELAESQHEQHTRIASHAPDASIQRISSTSLDAPAAAHGENALGIIEGKASDSLWISPSPFTVKMRVFCIPYAGGVSENVFAR